MSPKILIGLILSNLIWSANPTMGKVVLEEFAPAHAAWLRYASALLAFAVAVPLVRRAPRARKLFEHAFLIPHHRRDWGWLAALGFFTFCFSPFLQMTGLHGSRAVDNALIVAMEPLITVLLAWLLLRERVQALQWLLFFVALSGFFLLSGLNVARLSHGWDSHLFANLFILISLGGEAAYSVIGRKLVSRFNPVAVFGSALAMGLVFLTLAAFLWVGLPGVDELSHLLNFRLAAAVFWMGPLGTSLSYLYWMIALVEAPIASVALTLFIQPVMGALWGYLFLDERLTGAQGLGGGLILLAVFGPIFWAASARVLSGNRSSSRLVP